MDTDVRLALVRIALDRLEERIRCSLRADNTYYTSGRAIADEKRRNELLATLALEKESTHERS